MKKCIGIVLIILSVFACMCSWRKKQVGAGSYRASHHTDAWETPAPPDGTVWINEADKEELMLLPGVGETLAQAVLDERERNGSFYYAEDLMSVRGIGPSKLNDIFPWIHLGSDSDGE